MRCSGLANFALTSAALVALAAGGCAAGQGPSTVGTPDGGIAINSSIDAARRPPPRLADAGTSVGPVVDAAPRPPHVDAAPGKPPPDAFLPPPPPDAAPNAPPPDAAPPGCTPMTIDLLQNGSFDSGPGNPPWSESSSLGYELIATQSDFGFAPDTAPYAAWLGGDVNLNDSLGQQVTIPAGATDLKLSGKFFFITAEDTSSTTVFDQGGVGLFDTSGNVLETLATFDNTGAVSDPSQGSWTAFSRTATKSYAGQTIVLGFESTNDGVNPTSFLFDSVQLTVTVCK